tara:strand:+ start:529 stop:1881 length:1353 start_codon:yes stop_codon:yes gene_type:complete
MRIDINNSKRLISILQELTGALITNPITGITTDSRDCRPGDIYIALSGIRSDGHKFIREVQSKNAIAVIVSNYDNSPDVKIQQILVNDTKEILGLIANKWRNRFKIPIVAITGSNGKTSTRELLNHVLKEKYNVHATQGNYNTSIGLPLSLLELNKYHDISIIEMGANQNGDIKYLCSIANPTHGLITNISSAHLEGFESVENIVKTKGALFDYLEDGISYVNYADERVKSIKFAGEKITYGLNAECDYPADIHYDSDGFIVLTIDSKEIRTESKNLSFIKNAIAVTAVSISLGLNWDWLQERILTFKPPKGRCRVYNYESITIIDDTYNANLESCIAAIDYLIAFTGIGRKIVVFGDMLELGDASNEQHQKLGFKCSEVGLDAVFTIGNEMTSTHSVINGVPINIHFDSSKDLISHLKSELKSNDKILFKGSRGMKMEQIIAGVFKSLC